MKRLICASQLTKSYKARCVVDHIDLDIKEREIVALVGTNGAGKTTTIGMLLGIIPKDSGTIKYWTSDYKKEIGTQLQTTPFLKAIL
ncbi:ATP-binding cassette domain-containing protein [Lysinibacillus sp. BPa_S21]|uniref:ATP-binding cassette domain-containing protein n=1 Tax=Lysinibacillus sp. BPa_S21 TaxID=2932478 RepID=UPI0024B35CE5|nr:ATP-binding cassette domain-containing protein [Lysinibacillus sp. BPa_S21]